MKFPDVYYLGIISVIIQPILIIIFILSEWVPLSELYNAIVWTLVGTFAVSISYVIIESYRRQKNTKTKTKTDKKYNVKKLNDEVFRKLMRVRTSSDPFFFIHEMGFVIPTNKEEFYNKESPEYFEYLLRHSGDSFVHNYAKIESKIPSLKIGEDYLKENYPVFFKEWQEIKKIVEE